MPMVWDVYFLAVQMFLKGDIICTIKFAFHTLSLGHVLSGCMSPWDKGGDRQNNEQVFYGDKCNSFPAFAEGWLWWPAELYRFLFDQENIELLDIGCQ